MGIPIGRRSRTLAVVAAALVATSCTSNPPAPTPTVPSTPLATGPVMPPGSPAPTSPPAEPSPQAGLLLSEVRFAPAAGDPAFVEISNTSASPVDLDGASLSLDGAPLSLGRLPGPVPAGGVALVLLDGQHSTEGSTLHASAGFTLKADSGVVGLLDRTGLLLDRVAWGREADAVQLTNGTLIPDTVEPGITIGRPPGLVRPSEPLEWVVFGREEATPGGRNGLPAPFVLMPFDGAVLDSGSVGLAWYPVPGALNYRLQAQVEGVTSAEPTIEVTSSSPGVSGVATPGPGRYNWWVTAIAADGTESRRSQPSQFEVVATASTITDAAVSLPPNSPGRQLSVPVLSQRKDTAMLLLESTIESGQHAWDVAHPGLDPGDPADNKNCAIAAAAMVNHFLGGDLSQDRIGYELFKDRTPGPEEDLNWGYGILADDLTRALAFALGVAPTRLEPGMTPDQVWAATTASLDAGRPVLAAGSRHTIVLTGYSVVDGRRTLSYNNPWTGTGKLDVDAKAGALAAELDLWLPAAGSVGRMEEPSVKADSDGDGVVDFDEVKRFHTDPNRPDSDGDKVRDKQDILSGVFDPQYGYAVVRDTVGRDFDSDGLVTELDPDSDAGGCTDGEEDEDADGHRGGSETSNFDVSDDRCERHGAYGQVTWTSESVYDPGGSAERKGSETLKINVRLRDVGRAGTSEFVDEGSTYAYRATATAVIRSELADITSQGAWSGGGLIKVAGGVIVGRLMEPEDQFSIAATVPAQGKTTTDYGGIFIEVDPRGVTAATLSGATTDCYAKVVDLNARPRVYVYGCHESGEGFSWSMTGSITVP